MSRGHNEVVYLAWGPLGLAPVEAFASALERHPLPQGVEIVVIQNSVEPVLREAIELRLRPFAPRHVQESGLFDLEAYRRHAFRTAATCVLFCNSYSRPLVDGWAELLLDAARTPEVGIAGATATFESHWSHAPWFAQRTPSMSVPGFMRLQASMVSRAAAVRIGWPGRSSAYVRTNGFAMRPEVMRRLRWPPFPTKISTLRFESGRSNLTRQISRLGLRTVVVDRRARRFDCWEWDQSLVLYREGQPDLLIADNRTDAFSTATPQARIEMEAMAWSRGNGN